MRIRNLICEKSVSKIVNLILIKYKSNKCNYQIWCKVIRFISSNSLFLFLNSNYFNRLISERLYRLYYVKYSYFDALLKYAKCLYFLSNTKKFPKLWQLRKQMRMNYRIFELTPCILLKKKSRLNFTRSSKFLCLG